MAKSRSKKEIEALAQKVLADHGLLTLPIDPIEVAGRLGIGVYTAKFQKEDMSGAVSRKGKAASIFVNDTDAKVRKRFTIAHELGHYVLHLEDRDGEVVDEISNFRTTAPPGREWDEERVKEWEANEFAAALLMGAEAVRQAWAKIRNIEDMANFFSVSKNAMENRLSNLGILERV